MIELDSVPHEDVTQDDLKQGAKRSTDRLRERANQLALIQSCYTACREDEDLDYFSDSLLYRVCKDWVETGSKLSFEDWLDYYFEEDE